MLLDHITINAFGTESRIEDWRTKRTRLLFDAIGDRRRLVVDGFRLPSPGGFDHPDGHAPMKHLIDLVA